MSDDPEFKVVDDLPEKKYNRFGPSFKTLTVQAVAFAKGVPGKWLEVFTSATKAASRSASINIRRYAKLDGYGDTLDVTYRKLATGYGVFIRYTPPKS